MTREEMAQDIAYARSLAEEGRNAPLIGGAYLVLFGVLLTVCYGAQWAVLTGRLAVDASMIGMIWVGFGVAAGLGMAVLRQSVRNLPGGAAIPNRVDRTVWHGVVAALLAVIAATVLRAIVQGDDGAPNAIMAVGFGLYGVALYAAATIGGQLWLRGFALCAWITSGVFWYYLGAPWLYLLAAGASVLVLIAPGLIMMQRQPTAG